MTRCSKVDHTLSYFVHYSSSVPLSHSRLLYNSSVSGCASHVTHQSIGSNASKIPVEFVFTAVLSSAYRQDAGCIMAHLLFSDRYRSVPSRHRLCRDESLEEDGFVLFTHIQSLQNILLCTTTTAVDICRRHRRFHAYCVVNCFFNLSITSRFDRGACFDQLHLISIQQSTHACCWGGEGCAIAKDTHLANSRCHTKSHGFGFSSNRPHKICNKQQLPSSTDSDLIPNVLSCLIQQQCITLV